MVIALFLLVAFTLSLCIGLLLRTVGLLYCVDAAASHCCYFVVLLFRVVALQCYCFPLLFHGGVATLRWCCSSTLVVLFHHGVANLHWCYNSMLLLCAEVALVSMVKMVFPPLPCASESLEPIEKFEFKFGLEFKKT